MLFKKSKSYRMIDMHCHVLPGVDDGADSTEESLEMLRIAASEGITDMIVTPHYKEGHRNAGRDSIRRRTEDLQHKAEAEGINIKLYPGNEVYYFTDMEDKLSDGEILTLNDTDRMLVEFSPDASYKYLKNGIDTVISLGYTPILAHIERYSCILEKPERVQDIKNIGAEIQVNADTITGKYGSVARHFVHALLKDELVDYIGTDAHSVKSRAPRVKKCCEILYKKYDSEYVDAILQGNAACILNPEE